jgi:hypothetical protein
MVDLLISCLPVTPIPLALVRISVRTVKTLFNSTRDHTNAAVIAHPIHLPTLTVVGTTNCERA